MDNATQSYRLSAEQDAAVQSDAAAIVVVASAGSGKTEVVARRVERLLRGGQSDSFRVLALSYTVKAADELKARFRDRLGRLHQQVDTETVHGLAHALLRQDGTRIGLPIDPEVLTRDEDRVELLDRWLRSEGHAVPADLAGALQRIDLARARLEGAPLLDEWIAALDAAGAVDYAHMLAQATELLRLPAARRQMSRLYGHVIVDEAQNLTLAQYDLLTSLIGPPDSESGHVPAMVVGDDKQSIVGFAGADPTLIGRFERDYRALRFELTQNFRSAASIAALGDFVARRLGKSGVLPGAATYAAQGDVKSFEATDEIEEAGYVTDWVDDLLRNGIPERALAPGESPSVRPEDIAILARSAASLRRVREALESRGVPVAIASSPEEWLSTLPAKVLLALISLRSAANHQSTRWQVARLLGCDEDVVTDASSLLPLLTAAPDEALRAIAPLSEYAEPPALLAALDEVELPTDLGPEFLAAWEADCALLTETWRAFIAQADAVEQTWGNFRLYVARTQRGDASVPGVRLLTIHKAQSQEFRVVVLLGLNDGQLPDFRARTPADQTAELRAFYVAVTRASRLLLVTRPAARDTRYGPRAAAPSPYWEFLSTAS